MNVTPKPPSTELAHRLIYILYEAWVEARCYSEDSCRIFNLADTMHNLPALLENCSEDYLKAQREDLIRYCAKYPSARDYVRYLDHGVPDFSQWLWLWEETELSPSNQPS